MNEKINKPYILQNKKKVNNDKLRIKELNIKKEYVEIVLEHWDFKWIKHLGTTWADDTHYEFGFIYFERFIDKFRKKWENKRFIFELIVPKEFYNKYGLDDCCYHRQDKYETELLFKRE